MFEVDQEVVGPNGVRGFVLESDSSITYIETPKGVEMEFKTSDLREYVKEVQVKEPQLSVQERLALHLLHTATRTIPPALVLMNRVPEHELDRVLKEVQEKLPKVFALLVNLFSVVAQSEDNAAKMFEWNNSNSKFKLSYVLTFSGMTYESFVAAMQAGRYGFLELAILGKIGREVMQ